MELRHLRYFVAVAEALNFRRAAERLHVAQPALSRQIKDLEHSLGTRLLDRNTAGTTLTEAGLVLLEEARDILERLEMAAAMTRDAAAGRRGRLKIAGLGSMSANILSEALSIFRARYPRVEVSLHDVETQDLLAELLTGSIHLGFSFDDGVNVPREFEFAEVWESKTRVVLGKDHRLASQEKISLIELAKEDILCAGEPNQNDLHRKRTQAIFANRGIPHHRIKQVGSLESLIALVAGNYGVSVLFPNLSFDSGQIVLRPMEEEGDDLIIRMSAVWKKNQQALLARNFVDELRKTGTTELLRNPVGEVLTLGNG